MDAKSGKDEKKEKKHIENEKELDSAGNGEEASVVVDLDPLADAKKELLYMRAEFDNTKKRVLREAEHAIKLANEKLIVELLHPIDLMDRAIAAAKPLKAKGTTPEISNFITGVELTYRELIAILARFGVDFHGTEGEKFDPARHEAISQHETTEDKKDTIVEVLQKGSQLHGRLLKPAKVIVGRSGAKH